MDSTRKPPRPGRLLSVLSALSFRSPWRKRRASWEDLPEEDSADAGEHSEVLEAVLALPPLYRVPVHLFYYEELSVEEIAGVLGKSEGSVRTRLSRARTMLRKVLTEGGEDLV